MLRQVASMHRKGGSTVKTIARMGTLVLAVLVGVLAGFVTAVAFGGLRYPIGEVFGAAVGGLVAGFLAPFAATWVGIGVGALSLVLAVSVLFAIKQKVGVNAPIMTTPEILRSTLSIIITIAMAHLGSMIRRSWLGFRKP